MTFWFLRIQRNAALWMPTVAVLVAGLLASALLVRSLVRDLEDTIHNRTARQADLFAMALEQRVVAHGDIVYGMQTVFAGDSEGTRGTFADTLSQGLHERRPSTWALSFTHLIPAVDYLHYRSRLLDEAAARQWDAEDMLPEQPMTEPYYAVNYVWSTRGAPPKVMLNIEQPEQARDLLQRVEHTRMLQMSAPMLLEQGLAQPAMGMLVSAPVLSTQKDGGSRFIGSVNLSMSMASLVESLHGKGLLDHTVVSIRDVGEWPAVDSWGSASKPADPELALLYQSQGWVAQNNDSDHVLTRELRLLGRRWQLQFMPDATALTVGESAAPWVAGGAGGVMSVLLAIIVWLVARQRVRARLQAQARHNLLQSRANRFKVLFNQSAVGVVEFDPVSGRCKQVNQRLCELLGYSQEELQYLSIYNVIAPQSLAECRRLVDDLVLGRISRYSLEHGMLTKQGDTVWVEQWTSPLQDRDGKPSGTYIAMVQDVTVRRQMQHRLEESEAYSRNMLTHMPVGLVVVGAGGDVEYINHRFEEISGLRLQDLTTGDALWNVLVPGQGAQAGVVTGQDVRDMIRQLHSTNGGSLELNIQTHAGHSVPVDVVCNTMGGGRLLLSFVDLSQRKRAEEEIRWLAFYDTLTHLPNRRMLLDKLALSLTHTYDSHSRGALLLLDLDNFKTLNETLGHEHGDALLRLVAARLVNNMPRQFTLARQGGDEFALVLEDLGSASHDELVEQRTQQAVQSLLDALQEPFFVNNQIQHVTVCMGVALFGDDPGLTVEELLKRANLALHQAKSMGRGALQFFNPRMQQAVTARAEMEKDLRLALERHEFSLYYQPQVQGERVVGAEALLRWKHPDKGFISPGLFVPVAEESNIIVELGEQILYAACEQLAQWAGKPGLSDLSVAVNVSPRQFFQPDFVQLVQQTLAVTGAKPHLLELELTEGMLLADVDDTIRKMQQLKELGISFALDDFGTGYSSLSYLKRLPLDKLKIDQSFVREILVNGHDASIACTIVALGHSLGLRVIAEGVETDAQRRFLDDNGCTIWQGYLFSRPLPGADFESWVQDFQSKQQDALPFE